MPWEKSFVGLFEAHHPDVEVLNGAVASYSPSIYRKRISDLLDGGYKIDKVIIYIDISDIQDEAIYRTDDLGNIVDSNYIINTRAHVGDSPAVIQRRRPVAKDSGIGQYFQQLQIVLPERFVVTKYLTILLRRFFKSLSFHFPSAVGVRAANRDAPNIARLTGNRRSCPANVFCLVRSMWTIDGDKLVDGYGDLGVEGSIAKATSEMDAIASLLRARGIGFSIGVYPWPDQLQYDVIDSRQVTLWRNWCERNGCEQFINHFPDFFEIRNKQPTWLERLFIPGDFHFNEEGNRIVAHKLIEATEGIFRGRPP
jgi:hypothetical protein